MGSKLSQQSQTCLPSKLNISRWPSLVWQFLWAWIVAPIVLWRARLIHDTLGWRTQTVICCLAR